MNVPDNPNRVGGPIESLGEVIDAVLAVIRGELALARAETRKAMQSLNVAAGLIMLGFAFLVVSMNELAMAAVAGLVKLGIGPAWSSLWLGLGLMIVAYAIFRSGTLLAHRAGRLPERSIKNLRRDLETLKSKV